MEDDFECESTGDIKPYVIADGRDNSILFEWITENARAGISLEEDLSESGWYLIAKDSSGHIVFNEYGDLKEVDKVDLLQKFNKILREYNE